MKRTRSILSILPALSMLLLVGCKGGETASNAPAKSTTVGNSNQASESAAPNTNTSKQSEGSSTAIPTGPAKLIGTYESREVQDKGVVTVISQLKTLWRFSSDGTYLRESRVKGKPYHADSGTFRIEEPDKLVLTIQVTGLKQNRTVQSPPLSKTHKFSLSPDGEELRLISDKGSVGIFQRIARPQTP